ncbi:MAG: acetylxylan esterase, partial [Candidatus Latescibacteria bacterium]|nr:acetylxylan esterase [Candidatus Latescibacterota bacterium]
MAENINQPKSLLERGSREGTSLEAWQKRREEIREAWFEVAGYPPEDLEIPPLDVEYLDEIDAGDHVRHRVRYSVAPDERVEAWLCLPSPMPAGKLPAVLVLQGSHLTYNWGKDCTVGHRVDTEQAQAAHLARRGYVALAPDLPEAGRRTPKGLSQNTPRTPEDLRRYDPSFFFERHPDWSLPGKGVWDHQRAVDFLLTLDFVDPERIGCTGISYGGFFALLAGAFDERIRMTVPVVGWSSYTGTEQVRNLTSEFYFPRLADILDQHVG